MLLWKFGLTFFEPATQSLSFDFKTNSWQQKNNWRCKIILFAKLKKREIIMEKKQAVNPKKAETSRLWHEREKEELEPALYYAYYAMRKKQKR